MKKSILFLLILALFSLLLTRSVKVKAQDNDPMVPNRPSLPDDYHAKLTEKAIEMLPPAVAAEVNGSLWKTGNYADKPAVVAGSYEEDHPGEKLPWFHHSWDPDTNQYWFQQLSNVPWPLDGIVDSSKGTALDWADYYFREAIRLYDPEDSDNAEAYFLLGRTAHLLGDMAAPAHVHLDSHYPFTLAFGISPDHYETYLKNEGAALPAMSVVPWDYRSVRTSVPLELSAQLDAYNSTGGSSDTARELWSRGPISYSSRHYAAQERHRVDYDLFHIFHSMAEHADYFGSNDADGEQSTIGRRDDTAELKTIRDELFPRSAARIASLIQLFWDRTHASPNVDVVLIIDSSGSMGSNDRSNKRLDAAKAYLTASLPGDHVAVVDFDGSARLAASLLRLPDWKDDLVSAINTIDASGFTNIGVGVQMACDILLASTSGNSTKAAILLTDGQGAFGQQDRCFANKRWPVYTFGFGTADDNLLNGIASTTGGEFKRLATTSLICEFQAVRTKIASGVPGDCRSFFIRPNEYIDFPLYVASGQLQLTVASSWLGSDVEMQLTTPKGQTIDRQTVDPEVSHDLGPTFESYSITNPESGEWQVSLYGLDVPETGEEVTFSHTTIPVPPSEPGTITVVKQTSEAGEKTFVFNADGGSFQLRNGESKELVDLPSGDYEIVEEPVDGWKLDRVECSGGDSSSTEDGIIVQLDAGEDVICTFYNKRVDFAQVFLTESHLVSRVQEGVLANGGSKACYWLTLSEDPGDGEVVIDIGAPQNGQVTVSKSRVVLNSQNWDNLTTSFGPNFVCIRPINDAVDDGGTEICWDGNDDMLGNGSLVPGKECGDHLDKIQHTIASSTANGFDTGTPIVRKTVNDSDDTSGVVEILIQDDDEAGVILTESYGVSDVDESGAPVAQACYWVTLNSKPTADVTVSMAADGEVSVSPTSLTLGRSNWNAMGADGNRVCIYPQDDSLVDGAPDSVCADRRIDLLGQGAVASQVCGSHVGHVEHSASSSDPKYDGSSVPFTRNGPDLDGGGPQQLDVIVRNDDTPGVSATPEQLNVLEGLAFTYQVHLSAQPIADVDVNIELGEVRQASLTTSTLTFTSQNWDEPQEVTIAVDNNDTAEGTRPQPLTHAMRSDDRDFDGVVDSSVSLTVVDDDSPGLVIEANTLAVSEDGPSVAYQLRLSSRPQANVSVQVVAGEQLSAATETVVFTPANWNQPQTVQVRAVDDAVDEQEVAATVTHRVSSSDSGYDGIATGSVDVRVADNDTAGVVVAPLEDNSLVEGQTTSYEIRLASQPTAAVEVAINTDGRTTASPTVLSFGANNWSVSQTVRLEVTDDQVDAASDTYQSMIDHQVTSDDPFYDGITADVLSASITDNDVAAIEVSASNLEMSVGGWGTYEVVLLTQPASDVLIELGVSGEVRVSENCASDEGLTACIWFTPENWNTPQVVAVQGLGEGSGFIEHVVISADAKYSEMDVNRVQVTVEGDASIFLPLVSGQR